MSKKLTLFGLLLLIFATFSACTEDGDIVNPNVQISSPSDGDAFTVMDEITIVGRATDDVSLASVSVTSTTLILDETFTTFEDSSDFPFNLILTLDPNTLTGEYDITIRAVDTSGNEDESTVNIVVQ